MWDSGGAEHPLPVPADPRDYHMFSFAVLYCMCNCGVAEHPLSVPADPLDYTMFSLAAYV